MKTLLSIAEAELGQAEIAGPKHNKRILEYFKASGYNPPKGDEEAWCGAFMAWVCKQAGVEPPPNAFRARMWAEWGVDLGDKPVRGCVVVFKRGNNPALGHVAIFLSRTATHVTVLGGNQSNSVSIATYKASDVIAYRAPFDWRAMPVAKPKDLDAAGSRTTQAAARQQKDAGKAVGIETSDLIVPEPPSSGTLPSPQDVLQQGSEWKELVETLESLALFLWAKWPWIAAAFALYWLARMAYDAWRVRQARTEDHNTGANVVRV